MLSKNNKILIGCLALLLVMSVGYALFSDTITINGSATAKGDFELTTTCDMDAEALSLVQLEDRGSSSDAKISCEGNVVNASATLDYPGSQKYFRVIVTNTGTIPAKLKQVVELNNPEENIFGKDQNPAEGIARIVGDKSNKVSSKLFSDLNYIDDYETDPWGTDYDWHEEQLDAVLNPGETAYFYIEMHWFSDSTTPGDPLTATLNAQIDWQQVTE